MTPSDGRILMMDALRGFAVMGILLMNITAFALPDQAYINPTAWGGTSAADIALWFATFVAVDGKMRGLFALLFGASMLLVIDSAELAGRDGRRAHLSRSFWLLVIGALHYILFWWGDILSTYALVGLVALLFIRHDALALVKWAFLAFAVHFLVVSAFVIGAYAFRHQAGLPGASPATIADYAAFAAQMGKPGTTIILDQVALYRSTFPAIVAHHLNALGEHVQMLPYLAFETLGFMLLGMAMLKGGFLLGQWNGEQYRRTARHCFLIGLPPMIALGAWVLWSGFDVLLTFGAFLAWSFPFRIPLTVGYAALFAWIVSRAPDHPLIRRVAAAGRMALSNYLGSTLLMTAIFYGWGLGLYASLDRGPLLLFVLLGWALMLLWSKPWLDRFAFGPIEWLWRSLARGRLQPLKSA